MCQTCCVCCKPKVHDKYFLCIKFLGVLEDLKEMYADLREI